MEMNNFILDTGITYPWKNNDSDVTYQEMLLK